WLNWRQWLITSELVHQWIGAALQLASPDDHWLSTGFVDFITLELLRGNAQRFNLFNTLSSTSIFSMNYLEFQEINANYLYQKAPQTVLANERLESTSRYDRLHSFAFVRHALAMRSIKFAIGQDSTFELLRRFLLTYRGRKISPKIFYDFMS